VKPFTSYGPLLPLGQQFLMLQMKTDFGLVSVWPSGRKIVSDEVNRLLISKVDKFLQI